MISFTDAQKFLVTGAGSGIGQAVALLLNKLGATVLGIGRNIDKLQATRESCENSGSFFPYALDLTDLEAIPAFFKQVRNEHGKLAGMCSAAGTFYMDSLRNFSPAKSGEMNIIHFEAPLCVARNFSDRRNCMGEGASLVFIAALGGVLPQPGLLSYGAAKAALIAAAKSLARELGPRKIRVNSISPALVRTPFTEGAYAEFMGYDVLAAEEPLYPLGIGEPGDVAGMAVFLLSSASRWLTGQNIIMDGGRF